MSGADDVCTVNATFKNCDSPVFTKVCTLKLTRVPGNHSATIPGSLTLTSAPGPDPKDKLVTLRLGFSRSEVAGHGFIREVTRNEAGASAAPERQIIITYEDSGGRPPAAIPGIAGVVKGESRPRLCHIIFVVLSSRASPAASPEKPVVASQTLTDVWYDKLLAEQAKAPKSASPPARAGAPLTSAAAPSNPLSRPAQPVGPRSATAPYAITKGSALAMLARPSTASAAAAPSKPYTSSLGDSLLDDFDSTGLKSSSGLAVTAPKPSGMAGTGAHSAYPRSLASESAGAGFGKLAMSPSADAGSSSNNKGHGSTSSGGQAALYRSKPSVLASSGIGSPALAHSTPSFGGIMTPGQPRSLVQVGAASRPAMGRVGVATAAAMSGARTSPPDPAAWYTSGPQTQQTRLPPELLSAAVKPLQARAPEPKKDGSSDAVEGGAQQGKGAASLVRSQPVGPLARAMQGESKDYKSLSSSTWSLDEMEDDDALPIVQRRAVVPPKPVPMTGPVSRTWGLPVLAATGLSTSVARGLLNLGNTCYMASVLVMMLHSRTFVRALFDPAVLELVDLRLALRDEAAAKGDSGAADGDAAGASTADAAAEPSDDDAADAWKLQRAAALAAVDGALAVAASEAEAKREANVEAQSLPAWHFWDPPHPLTGAQLARGLASGPDEQQVPDWAYAVIPHLPWKALYPRSSVYAQAAPGASAGAGSNESSLWDAQLCCRVFESAAARFKTFEAQREWMAAYLPDAVTEAVDAGALGEAFSRLALGAGAGPAPAATQQTPFRPVVPVLPSPIRLQGTREPALYSGIVDLATHIRAGRRPPTALLQRLKAAVDKHNPDFRGTRQQDAHEFLQVVLTALDAELSPLGPALADVHGTWAALETDEQARAVAATAQDWAAWRDLHTPTGGPASKPGGGGAGSVSVAYLTERYARVRQLLQAEWSQTQTLPGRRSALTEVEVTLTCTSPTCGYKRVKLEYYFDFPLDVPDPSTLRGAGMTLTTLLDLFFGETQLELRCDKCCACPTATVQRRITGLPNVVLLQIKRFEVDKWGTTRKVEAPVAFPMVLDLSPYCVDAPRAPMAVDLAPPAAVEAVLARRTDGASAPSVASPPSQRKLGSSPGPSSGSPALPTSRFGSLARTPVSPVSPQEIVDVLSDDEDEAEQRRAAEQALDKLVQTQRSKGPGLLGGGKGDGTDEQGQPLPSQRVTSSVPPVSAAPTTVPLMWSSSRPAATSDLGALGHLSAGRAPSGLLRALDTKPQHPLTGGDKGGTNVPGPVSASASGKDDPRNWGVSPERGAAPATTSAPVRGIPDMGDFVGADDKELLDVLLAQLTDEEHEQVGDAYGGNIQLGLALARSLLDAREASAALQHDAAIDMLDSDGDEEARRDEAYGAAPAAKRPRLDAGPLQPTSDAGEAGAAAVEAFTSPASTIPPDDGSDTTQSQEAPTPKVGSGGLASVEAYTSSVLAAAAQAELDDASDREATATAKPNPAPVVLDPYCSALTQPYDALLHPLVKLGVSVAAGAPAAGAAASSPAQRYLLKGVVKHLGAWANSGHYTVDVLGHSAGKATTAGSTGSGWEHWDDTSVSPVAVDSVCGIRNQQAAYLLMYELGPPQLP